MFTENDIESIANGILIATEHPDSSVRRSKLTELETLSNDPNNLRVILGLLSYSHDKVSLFCLKALHLKAASSQAYATAVLENIQYIQEKSLTCPLYVQNVYAKLVAQLCLHFYPDAWPTYFNDLYASLVEKQGSPDTWVRTMLYTEELVRNNAVLRNLIRDREVPLLLTRIEPHIQIPITLELIGNLSVWADVTSLSRAISGAVQFYPDGVYSCIAKIVSRKCGPARKFSLVGTFDPLSFQGYGTNYNEMMCTVAVELCGSFPVAQSVNNKETMRRLFDHCMNAYKENPMYSSAILAFIKMFKHVRFAVLHELQGISSATQEHLLALEEEAVEGETSRIETLRMILIKLFALNYEVHDSFLAKLSSEHALANLFLLFVYSDYPSKRTQVPVSVIQRAFGELQNGSTSLEQTRVKLFHLFECVNKYSKVLNDETHTATSVLYSQHLYEPAFWSALLKFVLVVKNKKNVDLKALQSGTEALLKNPRLYSQHVRYVEQLGEAFGAMCSGTVYHVLNAEALDSYSESLGLSLSSFVENEELNCVSAVIGSILKYQGEWKGAQSYVDLAIALYTKTGDYESLMYVFQRCANCLLNPERYFYVFMHASGVEQYSSAMRAVSVFVFKHKEKYANALLTSSFVSGLASFISYPPSGCDEACAKEKLFSFFCLSLQAINSVSALKSMESYPLCVAVVEQLCKLGVSCDALHSLCSEIGNATTEIVSSVLLNENSAVLHSACLKKNEEAYIKYIASRFEDPVAVVNALKENLGKKILKKKLISIGAYEQSR